MVDPDKNEVDISNSSAEIDEYEMAKRCPICGSPMRTSGKLQMTNPLTGRKKMVQVYICSRCKYRSLG